MRANSVHLLLWVAFFFLQAYRLYCGFSIDYIPDPLVHPAQTIAFFYSLRFMFFMGVNLGFLQSGKNID
jgi:hypothetical protein